MTGTLTIAATMTGVPTGTNTIAQTLTFPSTARTIVSGITVPSSGSYGAIAPGGAQALIFIPPIANATQITFQGMNLSKTQPCFIPLDTGLQPAVFFQAASGTIPGCTIIWL